MKEILVLGSGRVAGPLIHYLLDDAGYRVRVATLEPERGEELIAGRSHGEVAFLDLGDSSGLDNLIRSSDAVVSMVPYDYHPLVARHCVSAHKSMVTASYVSDDMHALNKEAERAGVVLLNEIGLDPGIDHMSAMKLIHSVRKREGKVVSYRSHCGGIPSPLANNNPLGYKFSWNPYGALNAGRRPAVYLRDGNTIDLHGDELHEHTWKFPVEGLGELEAYPNRDSLKYIPLYGLEDASTVLRSTLRYPGWCETIRALETIGMFGAQKMHMGGLTLADLFDRLNGNDGRERAVQAAEHLDVAVDSPVMSRLNWLGLFSDEPVGIESGTPEDALVARASRLMTYGPDESDMLVLIDEVEAEFDSGEKERSVSTLIAYGVPGGDSAMARSVSLPAAVATRLIVEEKVVEKGVRIPIEPEIYEPVLSALEGLGIHLKELTEKLA